MRQSILAVALAGLVLAAGCGKKAAPPPPPPPPPAAPATPPPAPEPPPTREVAPVEDEYSRIRNMASDEIERMGLLADIHFDLDSAEIRAGDRQVLTRNADALKRFDFLRVTIEGHADERGTVEYNLALGERRAKAAYDYLVSLGVPADRLKSVSYGKEVPLCQQSTEECWARNRRDHFAVTGKVRQP
ncbi:MAG TPA: peptidoglycan-associated lipoprotein Pal [Vicinamibacteria bacterium]|nr:peptidoglycan-associated lipoprotein Pal [Vicinamibacteria bacterium]